jgi:hypothetical protein
VPFYVSFGYNHHKSVDIGTAIAQQTNCDSIYTTFPGGGPLVAEAASKALAH